MNPLGQFVRNRPRRAHRTAAPTTLESTFEDTSPMCLKNSASKLFAMLSVKLLPGLRTVDSLPSLTTS